MRSPSAGGRSLPFPASAALPVAPCSPLTPQSTCHVPGGPPRRAAVAVTLPQHPSVSVTCPLPPSAACSNPKSTSTPGPALENSR